MKRGAFILRDMLAGVSVAGLLLPSAIAYAAIAGLSPDHAIIATVIGLGVYAVFGRSRFAMVAPTSSSAAILAALIISMQRDMPQGPQVTAAAVLLAGGFFLAAGLLRAGALAGFISITAPGCIPMTRRGCARIISNCRSISRG